MAASYILVTFLHSDSCLVLWGSDSSQYAKKDRESASVLKEDLDVCLLISPVSIVLFFRANMPVVL